MARKNKGLERQDRKDKKDKKPGKKPNKKPPKDPDKKPPKKPKPPKDPNKGDGDKNPSKPDIKDTATTYYNIFAEMPEIDESNTEAIKEFADNLNKNLQSRSGELVARYSISEVDKLPKNYARAERYNDEDRPVDFDDIVSEQGPDDINTDIPEMVSPLDFDATYKIGSSALDGFRENVPNFIDSGSITWDLQLSIPDTIGVADYIVELAVDDNVDE